MERTNLSANNLRNVMNKEHTLPSTINASAISIGAGDFKLDEQMNSVKRMPNVNISFSLQNALAASLYDFTSRSKY